MKKAFTLLEFIFVIIVIGILSAVVIPKLEKNNLPKAAAQVASHLRYTQHLAMQSELFDANDAVWYQRRWRLMFSKSDDTDFTHKHYAYTIFADIAGGAAGNPDPLEVAVNPLNTTKRLTGGYSTTTAIHTGDYNATNEMNIGDEYGILGVFFSSACRTGTTSKTISFDHLGRPLRGSPKNNTSAYENSSSATNILISQQCVIDLCTVSDCSTAGSDEKISIAIEPETGYIHVL